MYQIFKRLDLHLTKDEYDCLEGLYACFSLMGDKELYLVGGCVRDALLGRRPKDFDLTTNARPDEIISYFKTAKEAIEDGWRIIETGLKHGTVTLFNGLANLSFEVTTFRSDVDYEDHRHPNEVKFSDSLEEDLKRRDLTINSFAYDFEHYHLYMLDESYLSDLELGVIKCVGDARERFEEDALRMLRTVRFAAQLNFSIEENTFRAMIEKADLMKYISKERIRDELTKILLSDHPEMLDLLRIAGIDDWCSCNLDRLLICTQHNKYHYTDVLHHTFDVIKKCPKDFITRWAALFHDMGKPDTLSVDEEGWEHYYNHPEISAKRAQLIMDDLKFTNEQKDAIYKLVKYHDADIKNMKMPGFKRLVNNVGKEIFTKYLDLRYADSLAHKLYDKDLVFITSTSRAKEYFYKIINTKEPMKIKDLAIRGDDIVKDGVLQGKQIGDCLNWMLEHVIEHPEDNTHEKLMELLETFKHNQIYERMKKCFNPEVYRERDCGKLTKREKKIVKSVLEK